jgi:hypothetical protein
MAGGKIGGGANGFLKGKVDEWAVYDYALTARQIRQHYIAARPYEYEILKDVPTAYYRMDEQTGHLRDVMGSYSTVTVLGTTPTYGIAAHQGRGIQFNSSGSFQANDAPGLALGDVFTMEAWVRIDATPATQWGIISKGGGGYYMRVEVSTTRIQLLKSGVALIASSTIGLAFGVWNHIVCTKNGASVHIYINGVDVTGAVTDATCINTTYHLQIGSDHEGGEPSGAAMNDVALYRWALAPDRILAHYLAGAPPAPKWVPLEFVGTPPAGPKWVPLIDLK